MDASLCGVDRWDTTLVDTEILTSGHNLVMGHCQVGSLTGAVAS